MKKKYLLFNILINLIGSAIIIGNLFWFSAPEYITIILAAFIAVALSFYLIKGNGKKSAKIVMGIFSVFSAGLTLFGAYCNPYWNSRSFKEIPYTKEYDAVLTYEEAKEDLDYFMHYLKKDHPMFLDGVPKEIEVQYEQALEELASANQIDVTMLRQKTQNIASILTDAHTYSTGYFENECYLKWIRSHREKGQHLVKVQGLELSELLEQKSDLYCYEVESWGLDRLGQDIDVLQGLSFLGIDVKKGVSYTFVDEDGNEEDVVYKAEDFVTWEEYVEFNQIKEDESDNESFVFYTIDKEKSLAVLTLDSCYYNEEYKSCLKEMFTQVKALGIENVAVDIRENGGGNSLVINEFMRYLDVDTYKTETSKWRLGIFNVPMGDGSAKNRKYSDLTFTGDLYCLTSESTFSSAMMFAEHIKANQLGTLIGEAPGNTPSAYGDIAMFSLPNSGIYVQISTKEFFQADKEATENLVTPDISCDSEEAMEVLSRVLEEKE